MQKILILFFSSVLIVSSCKKEEEAVAAYDIEIGAIITKQAVLKWYGDPAVDGAGLWATIENKGYLVTNYTTVDRHFYKDSISVLLTYKRVGKVTYANLGYKAEVDGIEILEAK